jgi:hypothetical protein
MSEEHNCDEHLKFDDEFWLTCQICGKQPYRCTETVAAPAETPKD